jgi:ADP-ribose pyrophosphatase YjhB (NUDIX family)
MDMADYIRCIRKFVGHTPIILNTATGIVMDHGKLLLQERAGGGWCLPGGYLEYGESYSEACKRELLEDTGLHVEVVRPLGLFDKYFMEYSNGDKLQNIGMLFLVKPMSGHLLSKRTNETWGLKYFDINHTPDLVFKQNQDMLDLVRDLFRQDKLM